MKLTVSEIFYSMQGETTRAGMPSLFIRLAGCNLHCRYCDTIHARDGGTVMKIDAVLQIAGRYRGVDHVTVTGGEPLVQHNVIPLMNRLAEGGFTVQLETNGTISLDDVHRSVRKIVDVKGPSSGEEGSFLMENLGRLSKHDEIKCIISDLADYDFYKKFLKDHLAETGAVINFSPCHGAMGPEELAAMVLKDRLNVRLNLQLHKVIWPDGKEGVAEILLDNYIDNV